MDDLKRVEGKSIKSIERDSSGDNSYLIIKFKEGGKMNIVSSTTGDGTGQLDVAAEGIKLDEIIGRKIHNAIEEFDGENDYLIINFKGGGKLTVNAFGSSEAANAILAVDVYVEPQKIIEDIFVRETLDDSMNERAPEHLSYVTDTKNTRYWALYAGIYEKVFQKIDNLKSLKNTLDKSLKGASPDQKNALMFFFRVRRDELEDPHFWDKLKESKEELLSNSLN